MMIEMLRAKIHRATVTEADLTYEGSISLCPNLIKASGFFLNEKVDIYNCTTGARFSTYVIQGKEQEVCLNGAAARLVQKGDIVIIASYTQLPREQASDHRPTVIFVDANNRMKDQRAEIAGRKSSMA